MFALEAVPVLQTERLTLRGWMERDFDPFAAMMAHPAAARFLTVNQQPMDRQTAWRAMATFIGHWALRGHGMFVIEERATGAFLGRAGPWAPEGWVGFEIGWALTPAAWGFGYATEAARAAGDWAFAAFDLPEVVSLIHVDNVRSQAVARRLGETPGAATLHAGMPHIVWRASNAAWRAAR